MRLEILAADGVLVHSGVRPDCGLSFWDALPPASARRAHRLVLSTVVHGPRGRRYRFAVAGLGTLRLELTGPRRPPRTPASPADVMLTRSRR